MNTTFSTVDRAALRYSLVGQGVGYRDGVEHGRREARELVAHLLAVANIVGDAYALAYLDGIDVGGDGFGLREEESVDLFRVAAVAHYRGRATAMFAPVLTVAQQLASTLPAPERTTP